MRRYWNTASGLNYERSIWIEQEDLGKDKVIKHRSRHYVVKIPRKIDKKVTVRLRGLGKTKGDKTGDLLLHIWLNRGVDIRASLWLSETSARNGEEKPLSFERRTILVLVPPSSHDGLVVRLKGLGKKPDFQWRAPLLRRKRGDLLVKLCVYPDNVPAERGSGKTEKRKCTPDFGQPY